MIRGNSTKRIISSFGMRSGFSMVELAISLVLMSMVYVSVFKMLKASNERLRLAKEHDFYDKFDKGIKTSFDGIINIFEQKCSSITASGQTGWGWNHASCSNTSPLPVFDSTGSGEKIVYSIDWTALTASENSTLENNILSSFSPYCLKVSKGANNLVLRCGNLIGFSYDLGAGSVASAHTAGTDINPTVAPNYTIIFRRQRETGGPTENITHNGTLARLWQKRQNYSLEKLNTTNNAFKSFFNGKLMLEVSNAAPGGLNSIDDEFVPWFWEAFGDMPASVSGAKCVTTGGVCTNLANPAIWKNTYPTRADMWRLSIPNIAVGNQILSVDGFNNMLRLLPIVSACNNADLSACTDPAALAVPGQPADNYFSGSTRPPFTSVIFNQTCRNTSAASPSYCRNYITY